MGWGGLGVGVERGKREEGRGVCTFSIGRKDGKGMEWSLILCGDEGGGV